MRLQCANKRMIIPRKGTLQHRKGVRGESCQGRYFIALQIQKQDQSIRLYDSMSFVLPGPLLNTRFTSHATHAPYSEWYTSTHRMMLVSVSAYELFVSDVSTLSCLRYKSLEEVAWSLQRDSNFRITIEMVAKAFHHGHKMQGTTRRQPIHSCASLSEGFRLVSLDPCERVYRTVKIP